MDSPLYNRQFVDQKPRSLYDPPDSIARRGYVGPARKHNDTNGFINRQSSMEANSLSHTERKGQKTIWDVLGVFAGVTSLQGVPYIQKANRWWSTGFWILAFLVGCGFMIFHAVYLITLYLEYETNTVVELGYDDLDFPSITVCNMNPFMKNKIHETSTEMENFLETIDPTGTTHDVPPPNMGIKPPGQPPDGPPPSSVPSHPAGGFGNPRPNDPARRFAPSKTESSSQSNLITFLELYGNLSPDTRRQVGQRSDTFIQQCSFNGYECDEGDFAHHFSPLYGNCWTFNSADDENSTTPLVSYLPGKEYGLNLRLYIEGDQYLPGVSEDVGVVVAVHPYRTMSFPEQNGISVAAGMTTLLGLKLVNVTRLGGHHKPCKTGTQFPNDTQIYTREACLATCTHLYIQRECKCFMAPYEYYYSRSTLNDFPSCSENNTACVLEIQDQISNGILQCGHCVAACNEKSYDKLISASRWPEESFYNTIVERACEKDRRYCDNLTQNPHEEIPKNFVNLKIYYRELNFENIEEQAAYPLVQFVSDVGGVLGLWVGISILSVVEILQLVFELLNFGCKKHCCRAN